MRILHAIYSMMSGGAELMLTDIANIQAEQGHEVHLMIINEMESDEVMRRLSPKVQVHRIHRPEGSRNPFYILKFNLALRHIHPDIVHIHVDSIMRLIVKSRKTKYVGTIHNTGIDVKHLLRADRIFAISQAVKDDLKSRLNIDSTIVVNGIDFDKIDKNKRKKPSSPLRMVQTGRVVIYQKGHDILIRAIAILKKKGLQTHVDFIGEPKDKEMLLQLANGLDVSDSVNFLGCYDRSDLYKKLSEYDLGVMPSRFEGFGLALVEAMAAAIPVIASNVDGPAEILKENRYGLLFESENPEALADAIAKVANAYPIFKANAETAAYRYAVENYSIDATANKYLEEYKKLL